MHTAVPRLYTEMVAEDRRLRLAGYEIYRFGGWEHQRAPEMALGRSMATAPKHEDHWEQPLAGGASH
ncbi:hypothetical protein ACWDDN_48215 [Streptomyces griseoruber]